MYTHIYISLSIYIYIYGFLPKLAMPSESGASRRTCVCIPSLRTLDLWLKAAVTDNGQAGSVLSLSLSLSLSLLLLSLVLSLTSLSYDTGVCEKETPFRASLCPAIQQERLRSSPWFGALIACLPASLLLRRSVFSQSPACPARFNHECYVSKPVLNFIEIYQIRKTKACVAAVVVVTARGSCEGEEALFRMRRGSYREGRPTQSASCRSLRRRA